MTPPTTATVSQPVADQRPEPPPFPTLYGVRYAQWLRYPGKWIAGIVVVDAPEDRPAAETMAQQLIADGHRNVSIVTIPGATP